MTTLILNNLLNTYDSEQKTPLQTAVIKGNRRTVRLLLCLGADSSISNGKNQTVYDLTKDDQLIALIRRYEKIIQNTIREGGTKLQAAVLLEDAEAIPVLAKVESVQLKNKEGRTALHLAALKCNLTVLRALNPQSNELEEKDLYGYTPLALSALEGKNLQAVNFFLSLGANPNISFKDVTFLEKIHAGGLSQKPIFTAVYSKIPSPTSKYSEMEKSIEKGSLRDIFRCLHAGVKVENSSFIHLAIKSKQHSITYFFIDWFNQNLNQTNIEQKTLLDLALIVNDEEIVDFLQSRNAYSQMLDKTKLTDQTIIPINDCLKAFLTLKNATILCHLAKTMKKLKIERVNVNNKEKNRRQVYLKAISIDPKCAEAYYQLGLLLKESSQNDISFKNNIKMSQYQLLEKAYTLMPNLYPKPEPLKSSSNSK